MDENVDGPIVLGLRRRGIGVQTIVEDGRSGLRPDNLVLDQASELERVLFTQDEDLLIEAAHRQQTGEMFFGVIFGPKGKHSAGVYVDDLELIATCESIQDHIGKVTFLPL
jgi:hypothetical protein